MNEMSGNFSSGIRSQSHSFGQTNEIAEAREAFTKNGQVFAIQRNDSDSADALVYSRRSLARVRLVRYRRKGENS